jgi:hypothetical protein
MKLLIRIPPTPRGCGFPAHVNEDEAEYCDDADEDDDDDLLPED